MKPEFWLTELGIIFLNLSSKIELLLCTYDIVKCSVYYFTLTDYHEIWRVMQDKLPYK